MLYTWTLSVFWVKIKSIVSRKMLMFLTPRSAWSELDPLWIFFFTIVFLKLSSGLWFNGQCLLYPNYLISFFLFCRICCWNGLGRNTKKFTFLISWNIFFFLHLHTAVMSWICTELGKKLAELPCWIWKFSCQTFSPLNNDYVVRLQASLLPSIQFHWKRETKPGGVKWRWNGEIRKWNKNYELIFLSLFQYSTWLSSIT